MPRVTLATQTQIETYISLLQQYSRDMNSTTTPCDDVRTARLALEFFSRFRDKAFKAFYARKILQLPPVIAAQVFDVSNGLISQAAGDRNVYTVANRSNSSSNELGVFNLPGGGVVATTMNNDGRQEIFKALTRIAIIKNRGVDVPNFQNRMVAGYMSESDADAFRAIMQAIAGVYANCPEMGGASMQPQATASDSNNYAEGLPYRRTNTIEFRLPQREQAVLDLIAAGTDRDTAQELVSELNTLGFNFTSGSRFGNELNYRLFYFGNISDAVSSADVLAMMASTLRLGPMDISMGIRNGDLQGTLTFSRQSAATTPSQPESTATPVLEYTRLMQEVGYPEMFATELLGDLNEANIEILSATPIFSGRGLDVNVQSREMDVVGLRGITRANWNELGSNQGVTTRGFPSVNVLDPNRYVIRIGSPANYGLEAESGSTQSTIDVRIRRVTNPDGLNSVEMASLRGLLDNMNYPNTFLPAVNQAAQSEHRIVGFEVTGENAESLPMRLRIYFKFDRNQTDEASRRLFARINRAAQNNGQGVGSFWGDFETGEGDVSYVLSRLPESTSTASTASTATVTAPVPEEVSMTYEGIEVRYPNLISRADYTTIRNSGYSRIQARSLLDFINSYGLGISSVQVIPERGRAQRYLKISVRGVNSSARSFRNTTFLRFLRGVRSVAEDSAVQVLGSSGRRYFQSATFRGTGRGQTPVGVLVLRVYSEQTQTAASASQPTSQPMTPTGGVNRQIVYLGNVQGRANMVYRGGPKRFFTNGIFGTLGPDDYSAIAFFYDPSQGSMPGSILTAPLGVIARSAGPNFSDVMNYLADNGRFENPGKLKAYFVRENAVQVAKGIVGGLQNTFTPVRPSGGAKEITVDRVRLYTPSEFAQWASTEPMLGVFRGIAGQGTATGTSPITMLSNSQLKSLATSPYSFGFGVEFEGFIRQGTRVQLSQKMRRDGIKIYTTIGYQSKTPVQGEDPYVDGHIWRQESDSSVQGYDARSSGGTDRSGEGQTFEMVSKILNSSADNKSGNNSWIPQMENFCDSLAKNGVLIDPSSGIHIHVGYPNFNAEQTKNLFINSVLMIPVLKGLVSEAWKSRGYAKFPNNSDLGRKLSQIANAAGEQRNVVRAYESQFGTARYSFLNTSNFGYSAKPTFEYRFQGSSIEKDTMVNTIRILQQIWKASLEGVIPIKEGYGKEQDQVLVDLLGTELFSFARNRFAETELPKATDSSSKGFPGFKFPINASSIT